MTKEITKAPSEQALAELREMFPVDAGFQRVLLPRLNFASQDKTEGKGKAMKVVTEAGTFIAEKQTEELDENGKKIWAKDELGKTIEGIILYQRKQLRYYDEANEVYTSSPIYDSNDEVVVLFCDKKEVARGTPDELKAKYQYVNKEGKTKSKLEENRILYVRYNDEIYQLNLRGSSMYSFLGYARKTLVPAVLTVFNSESKEKGTIAWNQMTFEVKRQLNADEVADVQAKAAEIIDGIKQEKAYYAAAKPVEVVKGDDGFGDFGS